MLSSPQGLHEIYNRGFALTTVNSDRLFFKTLTKDDVSEQYLRWLNDPDINQYLETRFNPQSPETCEQFISDMEKDPSSHLFGIYIKDTLEHIGNIKLGFINTYHRKAQLSLFIGEKSCWGIGYASEAINSITKWGFDTLGLEKIEAGCYDLNTGSLRAFLKAGYSVEGYFRKNVIYNNKRIGSFWLGKLASDQNL